MKKIFICNHCYIGFVGFSQNRVIPCEETQGCGISKKFETS